MAGRSAAPSMDIAGSWRRPGPCWPLGRFWRQYPVWRRGRTRRTSRGAAPAGRYTQNMRPREKTAPSPPRWRTGRPRSRCRTGRWSPSPALGWRAFICRSSPYRRKQERTPHGSGLRGRWRGKEPACGLMTFGSRTLMARPRQWTG